MKDLKNQKILIGLLIFIMSLMLILTFKFTFMNSKKIKNVEHQNTQTKEEVKEIEDTIKEDEVLTEEHKEEMTQEEKRSSCKR